MNAYESEWRALKIKRRMKVLGLSRKKAQNPQKKLKNHGERSFLRSLIAKKLNFKREQKQDKKKRYVNHRKQN